MAEELASNPLFELEVNYAMRALMGGGKGRFVMEQLKENDPEFYQLVMAEAQRRLDKLDPEYKKDRIGVLCDLVSGNLKNMVQIVEGKESDKG